MIGSKPKIVVIDNEETHLHALVKGLNSAGLSCLPYHFTGNFPDADQVSDCRVIFCDLHLNEIPGGAGGVPELAAIASFLMEVIAESHGPYLLVLWSRDSEWMAQMETYIEAMESHQQPVCCIPLDKHDHINITTGEVQDLDGLKQALVDALDPVPSIKALFEIESAVNEASTTTVGQLYSLADPDVLRVGNRTEAVSKLLGALAEAASGKGHAQNDPWTAVIEALTPLIGDKLRRSLSHAGSSEFWQEAVDVAGHKSGTTNQSAAAINSMLNLDLQTDKLTAVSRGAVCSMPASWSETARFGIKKKELFEFFGILQPDKLTEPQWRLIQVDAACDSAQQKPGVVPYVLALQLPRSFANNSKKASSSFPEALWKSPWFGIDGEIFQLRAHPRLIQGFAPTTAQRSFKLVFRIRDQLLEDLVFRARTYAARPGYVAVKR